MTITIENKVPNVVDFLLNGKIVAVIALSGNLVFIRYVKLNIKEIEAIENAYIEYIKLN